MPKGDKLTSRQRKFIEAYQGNGTEAARLAGYSGDDNALGVMAHSLLRNAKIAAAIKEREDEEIAPLIATRKERQEFWTEVMKNTCAELRDRLRASEILGKSQSDFTEKIELSGQVTLEDLIDGSRKDDKKGKGK